MTWIVDSGHSGTFTPTVGTEAALVNNLIVNATYVLQPRLTNMALGDVVEFRCYVMTLGGGVEELAWKMTFGPWAPLILCPQSPPIPSDQSIEITIKQIAGTAKSIDWKLLRI
jgi:hypothetical protein